MNMTNMLLYLHILSGASALLVTLATLLKSMKLDRIFIPSFIATATSGAALIWTSGQSITAVCVRFIIAMFVLSVMRFVTIRRLSYVKTDI